jgi:hypothetical protein
MGAAIEASSMSPDLVLVLPEEERRRAIAELPPFAAFPTRRALPVAAIGEDRAHTPLTTAILRYTVHRAIAVSIWYVGIAIGIGLLTALLAQR